MSSFRADVPKIVRYLIVSGFNIVAHQLLLFAMNSGLAWPGGRSNVIAALVVSVPAYFLSRNWVWELTGEHDLRSHVMPFWVIALLGLILSTGFAWGAEQLFGSGLPVNGASLLGYFIVWVCKFLLLDRVFAEHDGRPVEHVG